ncbi:MAG: hypothetical protein C4324_06065 [Blastocatellia bacterium]
MILDTVAAANANLEAELFITDESEGNCVRLPARASMKFPRFGFGRRFKILVDAAEHSLELTTVKLLRDGPSSRLFLCESRIRAEGQRRGYAICEIPTSFSILPSLRNVFRR